MKSLSGAVIGVDLDQPVLCVFIYEEKIGIPVCGNIVDDLLTFGKGSPISALCR